MYNDRLMTRRNCVSIIFFVETHRKPGHLAEVTTPIPDIPKPVYRV